jgi:hypothetical protein
VTDPLPGVRKIEDKVVEALTIVGQAEPPEM